MLAESEAANLVIFAIIVIAIIVGRVVEYFRKQKAEEEAKARRLKGGREAGGEQADAKPEAQPAAGGLQALLDALGGRTQDKEPPAESAERVREHSEVWDVDEESRRSHDFAMERASFEHARPREPEIVAAPPVPEEPVVEEPKAPEADVAPSPALAAVGLVAGPGGPPLRDQARRGILWSVVLGSPRGTVPYGERGASEAPGGIV